MKWRTISPRSWPRLESSASWKDSISAPPTHALTSTRSGQVRRVGSFWRTSTRFAFETEEVGGGDASMREAFFLRAAGRAVELSMLEVSIPRSAPSTGNRRSERRDDRDRGACRRAGGISGARAGERGRVREQPSEFSLQMAPRAPGRDTRGHQRARARGGMGLAFDRQRLSRPNSERRRRHAQCLFTPGSNIC